MRIAQDNTDLGGSETLLGELGDQVLGFLGGGLQPAGSAAAVGDGGTRNTFTRSVHASHGE